MRFLIDEADSLANGYCNCVFHISSCVTILWILKRIGGTPKAEVKANVKRCGGNLTITSGGLVGSFLAIAILAFVAIYLIAKLASA